MSIVQLSRFLSFFICDSFDILSNLFRFVKNFFILFFLFYCLSRVSSDIIPFSLTICQLFFTSFSNLFSSTISGIFTWYHPQAHLEHTKTTGCPSSFRNNIKRRKRDLNPRAGFPTYTLSRGASSASWVFLRIHISIWNFAVRSAALTIIAKSPAFVNGVLWIFLNIFTFRIFLYFYGNFYSYCPLNAGIPAG